MSARPSPPRLQVRVTQARKPPMVPLQPGALFEEAEGDDEREERMRDRAVALVEQPEALIQLVNVSHVQVIVLHGRRQPASGELDTKLLVARQEVS
jgi:hypothetical protein